jgi:ubiquinone/menaquinone biosynthesis C-methylase UbiE
MNAIDRHENVDPETVRGFGEEWTKFDQHPMPEEELGELFRRYFRIFPWASLPVHAVGFDLGCGSGRWAKLVARQVGRLHCIDASAAALTVAQRNLQDSANCEFHVASVSAMPLADNSMDFGYSIGVLHHLPDTEAGLQACVAKLKPGAPFLLYLYYAFDNRPAWFRMLWRLSDLMRQGISQCPFRLRYWLSQGLAAFAYYPLARLARFLEWVGVGVEAFPLSFYRRQSYYVMRTDALDRFGTHVEQRFKRTEIHHMMERAGLGQIRFSESAPYWCAVGFRR